MRDEIKIAEDGFSVTINGERFWSPMKIRSLCDIRYGDCFPIPEVYAAGGVYLPMASSGGAQ